MSTKNLSNEEARQKIKELAESIDLTMMATNLKSEPFHVIPMSTKEVDAAGNIWFLSNKNSEHNQNIEKENKTQLIYADKGNFEFMSIYGRASISTDRNRIKELYGSGDDAWFDGVDDPNITAIKIQPDEAHYWDTKHGKVLSLLKMAKGAITGDEPDLGEQGNLKV
ncbi:putative stress protein (general stress protein 26) [Aequorivita sublithincola DSM 14238]|uniref:Putative stress protein (General stress protein 26) n=1 Tax=Aequorivita sublithincola (strain DSM 14238 / LMG 21431 / ACAM 643 / 9-3) TaxID=746697 RepID=I3YVL3_AEQSU|nr:pyridoxamine 5'-phosphate oxidase family protein [Aequorivita sublithincola]AFL81031.1 putative stress protein (general stress protein 26) [Aequorivita sublithincola DSM 14238]